MTDSVAQTRRALTPAQREAVMHETGPLMVLAGPGSGKTRVVTERVASLIERGVDSRRIVALTFTNKAADEMKTRVAALAGNHDSWISTFHRFCSHLLRRYSQYVGLQPNFSILDTQDSLRVLQAVMQDEGLHASRLQPRQLLRAISHAKQRLIGPEQLGLSTSNVDTVAALVYPHYQQRLLRANAVDFDDLLVHVAHLLAEHTELRTQLDQQIEYLLVDEYQDTNHVQYRIVQALSQELRNLTVTGDPDQSIYGWRGADLNSVFYFERDYPDVCVVRLEQNFRSSAAIVRVADVLIAHNRHRKAKSLIATKPMGPPVHVHRFSSGEAEAAWIAETIAEWVAAGTAALDDFAVLYRVNACSRLVEHALRSRGIPYRVVNGLEFYQRKEIKDVLAYLTLIDNPQNDAAFLRIINEPLRGIGQKSLEHISRFAAAHAVSLWEAASTPACQQTLSSRAAKGVKRFVEVMDELMQPHTMSLASFISRVLDQTGYRQSLSDPSDEQDRSRQENLAELIVAADSFTTEMQGEATLERFLEQHALVNETDDLSRSQGAVTLITLHGAKGLEFTNVFVIAVEQGLLPHARCLDNPLEEEEERRLFFVGITRAQSCLHVTYADYRGRQETLRRTVTSPFLVQLPSDAIETVVHADPLDLRGVAAGDWEEGHQEHAREEWEVEPAERDGRRTVAASAAMHSPAPRRARPRPQRAAPAMPREARLTTAASLLGEAAQPAAAIDPDRFHADMLVTHPELGHGKVISLSGKGVKRTAKVVFFSSATERTFVLVHSPLQPLQA